MQKMAKTLLIGTFSIFLLLTGTSLFSDGMFMDGLYYATISRNLSLGIGSFWQPIFSPIDSTFTGHPPLAFGLQSLCFSIFGDSIYVERFYSLFTFIISGVIIYLIWKEVTQKQFHPLYWLPLFLWILVPLVPWAAANNILENTMSIFVHLAVLFILKSIKRNTFTYLFLAGILLFFGFLTKGFTALYPLSLPFLIGLVSKMNIKDESSFMNYAFIYKVLPNTVILILATTLPLFLMYLFNKEGILFLEKYIDTQVIASLKTGQTVNSRLFIVERLIWELLPSILFFLLIIGLSYRKKIALKVNPFAVIFILLGLSGVLPIMISLKQSGFYMLTTFPFFGIAGALIMIPFFDKVLSNISDKSLKKIRYFTYSLLMGSIFLSLIQINKIGREKKLIEDVYIISNQIPFGETVQLPSDLWNEWYLIGYFARTKNIALDFNKQSKAMFYLCRQNSKCEFLHLYTKVNLNTNLYDLYSKRN